MGTQLGRWHGKKKKHGIWSRLECDHTHMSQVDGKGCGLRFPLNMLRTRSLSHTEVCILPGFLLVDMSA